jgi:hypothetical protein
MKGYTYFGIIITNKNKLRLEIEKKSYMHVEHNVHFSTNESISTQRKTKIYMILIRPLTRYGAESWTLINDIAKRLAAFEKKL